MSDSERPEQPGRRPRRRRRSRRPAGPGASSQNTAGQAGGQHASGGGGSTGGAQASSPAGSGPSKGGGQNGGGQGGSGGGDRRRRRRGGRGRGRRGQGRGPEAGGQRPGAQRAEGERPGPTTVRAGDGTNGATAAHRPGKPGAKSGGGRTRPAQPGKQTGASGGQQTAKQSGKQPAAQGGQSAGGGKQPAARRGRGNQRPARAGGRPARGGRPNARLTTVLETSAGGLVVRGLAESMRGTSASGDPEVDLSALEVALIGRLDRRGRMLWSMPKGHIEEGETIAQTARREVLEETGLDGTVLAPLGDIDYWFVADGRRIHKTVHHHLIRYDRGELCDEDPEITEVAWVPFETLPDRLAYPDERRLVDTARSLLPGLAAAEHAGRGPAAERAQVVDPARRLPRDSGGEGGDRAAAEETGS